MSVDLHAQLIERIAAGDVPGAATLAFDMWHTLPAEAAVSGGEPGAGDDQA